MNLILLFPDDFTAPGHVRLTGRRLDHVLRVHRAQVGEELFVGLSPLTPGPSPPSVGLSPLTPGPSPRKRGEGSPPPWVSPSLVPSPSASSPLPASAGRGWLREAEPGEGRETHDPGGRATIGRGTITHLDSNVLEMSVTFTQPPPPKLPITLILALPRPKVLNRVIAAATSLGVPRIVLINAWRVEKSYWKSPRLAPENLLEQSILGLEQARDTLLPAIELRQLFRPFVEDELPAVAAGTLALVAHPGASEPCPPAVQSAVTLAIGPEGGFIAEEVASLERAGFQPVTLGDRVLRVETAVASLLGRLF